MPQRVYRGVLYNPCCLDCALETSLKRALMSVVPPNSAGARIPREVWRWENELPSQGIAVALFGAMLPDLTEGPTVSGYAHPQRGSGHGFLTTTG